jgi:hypothetical protein
MQEYTPHSACKKQYLRVIEEADVLISSRVQSSEIRRTTHVCPFRRE